MYIYIKTCTYTCTNDNYCILQHNRSLMDRIEMGHALHETCTNLLASNDSYNLLTNYPQVTQDIKQLFNQFPSVDPVGRDDLIFEYPKDSLEELETQFVNHGSIRASTCVLLYIVISNLYAIYRSINIMQLKV